MKGEIAIIITAYDRAEALTNLLYSISKINCDQSVDLMISIDNGGTNEVNEVANDFKWVHGEKKVIIHNKKLGLKEHFIWVGDQTETYENVIFLEDDLFVSPEVINFSMSGIDFYSHDEKIAGISLYNPILCEFTGCKFYQNHDGYDVYFLQHPYWGNVWMKSKWKRFKEWLKTYKPNAEIIPQNVYSWRESSFKKIFIQYLVEMDKYIVVPRVSLVTNNAEVGLHNKFGFYQYQVVMMNEQKKYIFCSFCNSKSVYDAFMEINPEILKYYNNDIVKYDFEVDLKGIRHNFHKEYVLTTRTTKNSIITYTDLMKPTENGVIYAVKGQGISLCRARDVDIFGKLNNQYNTKRLYKDMDMNYVIDFKTKLMFVFEHIIAKLRKMLNGFTKIN